MKLILSSILVLLSFDSYNQIISTNKSGESDTIILVPMTIDENYTKSIIESEWNSNEKQIRIYKSQKNIDSLIIASKKSIELLLIDPTLNNHNLYTSKSHISNIYRDLAKYYCLKSNPKKAIRAAENGIRSSSQNEKLLSILGISYILDSQKKIGTKQLEAFWKKIDSNAEQRTALDIALNDLDDIKEALKSKTYKQISSILKEIQSNYKAHSLRNEQKFSLAMSAKVNSFEEAFNNPLLTETVYIQKFNSEELPNNIDQLENLEALYIKSGNLKTIPSNISKLQGLKVLEIGSCPILEIPNEVFELKNLEQLKIYGTQIDEISPRISKLQNLIQLNLSGNALQSIPKEIFNLKKLKSVNLKGNNLKKLPIPNDINYSLRFLNLDKNNISEIPKTISNLKSLSKLYVSHNGLKKVHPNIKYLYNLFELILYNNEIQELKIDFGKLYFLRFLVLGKNQLNEKSINLDGIFNLTKLSINDNKFTTIPKLVSNCQKLEELYIANNPLHYFPEWIPKLNKLKILDIGNLLTKMEKINLQKIMPNCQHVH